MRAHTITTALLATAITISTISATLAYVVNVFTEPDGRQDDWIIEGQYHELGILFPPDELITTNQVPWQGHVPCPVDYLGGGAVQVRITNLTATNWTDVYYVADPETSLSNVDELVGHLGFGGPHEAFKIDAVGLNTPLVYESISFDGVFQPGETWEFVIQDYSNLLGLAPTMLDSFGIADASIGGPPSSGSIIAAVPPHFGDIWYVDQASPQDGPGTNWPTAFHTIQGGVDAAGAGDTVYVTNGLYDVATEIVVDHNIVLTSVNGADVTIVDGGLPGRCFNLGSSACLVSGFTIANGISDGAPGGGIYCEGTAPRVVDCTFTNNRAVTHSGGGMYGGKAYNCTFVDNWASENGGGKSGGMAVNCIFMENKSYSEGGAMEGTAAFNCTVVNNEADYGGGMMGGTAYNCMVWFNTAFLGENLLETTASYTGSPDVLHGSSGNITNAPAFINGAPGNNYRQSFGSPCIGAGSNAYVSTATDLDGQPRIVNGTVDMGVYEYDATVYDSDLDGLTDDAEVNTHGTDPLDDDGDDDGLTDGAEINIHGTDPQVIDTDDDGFDDGLEVSNGSSPTNSHAFMVDYMRTNGVGFGLYTSNSIMDLDMGYLMIQASNDWLYLSLQLEQCTNLVGGVWTNIGDAVEWLEPATEGKSFFRVRGGP